MSLSGYLPLSAATIEIVQDTAPIVGPLASRITADFYPRMFSAAPAALSFFNKTNQSKGNQSQALADAVVAYAVNIDKLENLGGAVAKITHRHCGLGVTPELYQIVHDNLMGSIVEVLQNQEGINITEEIVSGWSNAVMALAEICSGEEEKLYQKAEARKGGWRGFKEFSLARKTPVGEDTVRFEFEDGTDTGFDFTPGQYLSIRIDEEKSGVTAPRHYTVTSKPGETHLAITTRLVQGGAVSTYMHKELEVGDKVRLAAPFGVFTPDHVCQQGSKIAYVTAGIGITPALAFSQTTNAPECAGGIHIDRTSGHTSSVAELLPANVKQLYGQSRTDTSSAIASLPSELGTDIDYLVCGPAEFMKSAVNTLKENGATRVHAELFGTGSLK